MAPASAKRRVLVVGGGAAGTAAAWSLSRSPRFAVSLWESAPTLGGVATTEKITLPDGSVVAINDGVQGGAPSYRNCLGFHAAALGFAPQEVVMKVAFGKGAMTWSNVGAPSELVWRMQPEIARFGRALQRVDALRLIFAFVPIRRVLSLWRFDPDFGARLVYPLTALFFGTGNRTPEVSAAIVARVFLDPKLRLFDYSPERLLSGSPEMFAFEPLGDIYGKAADVLRSAGVDVRLSCACASVARFPGAADAVVATDAAGAKHSFDAVVFACDAATAARLLERPGFWERRVLGAVRYYDDVTYTHCDEAYMREHYEMRTDAPEEQADYYIWSHPGDASKLEMSFDLGHYQPRLRSRPPGAPPIYQARLRCGARACVPWPDERMPPRWRRAFSWTAPGARRPGPWTALPRTRHVAPRCRSADARAHAVDAPRCAPRSCWSSGGGSSATRRRTSAPSCPLCAWRRAARAAPPSTRAPGRWSTRTRWPPCPASPPRTASAPPTPSPTTLSRSTSSRRT